MKQDTLPCNSGVELTPAERIELSDKFVAEMGEAKRFLVENLSGLNDFCDVKIETSESKDEEENIVTEFFILSYLEVSNPYLFYKMRFVEKEGIITDIQTFWGEWDAKDSYKTGVLDCVYKYDPETKTVILKSGDMLGEIWDEYQAQRSLRNPRYSLDISEIYGYDKIPRSRDSKRGTELVISPDEAYFIEINPQAIESSRFPKVEEIRYVPTRNGDDFEFIVQDGTLHTAVYSNDDRRYKDKRLHKVDASQLIKLIRPEPLFDVYIETGSKGNGNFFYGAPLGNLDHTLDNPFRRAVVDFQRRDQPIYPFEYICHIPLLNLLGQLHRYRSALERLNVSYRLGVIYGTNNMVFKQDVTVAKEGKAYYGTKYHHDLNRHDCSHLRWDVKIPTNQERYTLVVETDEASYIRIYTVDLCDLKKTFETIIKDGFIGTRSYEFKVAVDGVEQLISLDLEEIMGKKEYEVVNILMGKIIEILT